MRRWSVRIRQWAPGIKEDMFENIKLLLEIVFNKSAVQTYWDKIDDESSIGYFSPTDSKDDVYFINVKHGKLKNLNTLIFSFGFFVDGKAESSLTKRNDNQYKIFATVIKEINAIVKKLNKENLVILFTAKKENDSEEDYQRRVSLYSLLAESQQKILGFGLMRLETEEGKLFCLVNQNVSKLSILKILSDAKLLSLANVKQLFKK